MPKVKTICDACKKIDCPGRECEAWQADFISRWDKICRRLREHAWKQADRHDDNHFKYGTPDEMTDPCENCPCDGWCFTPCSRRLKWWDHQIGRLRSLFEKRGGEK